MHLLDLQDPKSIGQAGPWFLHQKKPMTDQSTLSLPGHAVVTIVPSWPSSPGGGGVEPAWGLWGLQEDYVLLDSFLSVVSG